MRNAPKPDRTPLRIINPNRQWVITELEKLLQEWLAWQNEIEKIVDQPYDRNVQLDVFADGADKMECHHILQEKTLTFLDNNVEGHGFIVGRDGDCIDRIDLRLKIRVAHRLRDIKTLQASLPYALVPESYWKEKGKELVNNVLETASKKGTEKAIDVAAGYLKNPF